MLTRNAKIIVVPVVSIAAWLGLACSKDEGERTTAEPQATTAGAETPAVADVELETAPNVELEGQARLDQEDGAVRVVLEVDEAAPGRHGVHVHEKGDCSDIPGKSMGEHFAPRGHEHGLPTDPQRPPGDLGNIDIDASGEGTLEITVENATLKPGDAMSFSGKALVIHEGADTREGPSGEAGTPIACGVIEPD